MVDRNEADAGIKTPVAKIALVIFGMLALVVLAGYGITLFLDRGQKQTVSADIVPVIRADKSPMKEKPKDAGGLKVPFKDKLIYERIKPNGSVEIGEKLLPPPESPVEKPTEKELETSEAEERSEPEPEPTPLEESIVSTAEEESKLEAEAVPSEPEKSVETGPMAPREDVPDKTETVPDSAIARLAERLEAEEKAKLAQKSENAVVKQAESPAKPAFEKPEKVAEAQDTPAGTPVPKPKPIHSQKTATATKPAPQPAPVIAGDYRVQLAAFRDRAAADKAWTGLKGKHPKQLGALSPFVSKVDLGTKGIFHRLQAGPLVDRTAADKLCAALKARKQGCLPVKAK